MGDQHDAYSIAAQMNGVDFDGSLASYFKSILSPAERSVAQIEGMMLGIPGLIPAVNTIQ